MEAIRQIDVIRSEQAEIVRVMKVDQEMLKESINLTDILEARLQEYTLRQEQEFERKYIEAVSEIHAIL